MSDQVGTAADPEAELRWRNWQARGAESDRRTSKRMGTLLIVIAAAIVVWFLVHIMENS